MCPVLRRGPYIKWAEPKCGASPGSDIYPEPQRRRPRTGLRNGFIEDVPLPDPVRIGLPEFDSAPLKKRLSWRPWSPQRESVKDVLYLMGRIRLLAHSGLTMIGVMAACIMRGVQPLQYRGHPMWDFNGEDDATHYGRKGLDSTADLTKTCSLCTREKRRNFSASTHRVDFLRTIPQAG